MAENQRGGQDLFPTSPWMQRVPGATAQPVNMQNAFVANNPRVVNTTPVTPATTASRSPAITTTQGPVTTATRQPTAPSPGNGYNGYYQGSYYQNGSRVGGTSATGGAASGGRVGPSVVPNNPATGGGGYIVNPNGTQMPLGPSSVSQGVPQSYGLDYLAQNGVGLQQQLLQQLMGQSNYGGVTPAAYSAPDLSGMQNYQNQAANIWNQLLGVGQQATAVGQKYAPLSQSIGAGNISPEYQANFERAIQGGVDRTMGSNLANLASRGVVNSTTANRSMDEIGRSVASASAQNFLNSIATALGANNQAYNQELGGLGAQMSGLGTAGSGMSGLAGQSADAALTGANMRNNYNLQSAQMQNQNAQSRFGNTLTAMQAAMMPFNSQIGAASSLYGLGNQAMEPMTNLYQMWWNGRHSLQSEPIVTQNPGIGDYLGALMPFFL